MDEISQYFNIIRLFVGISILLYASYTDLKTRKAPNILWIIIGFIGIFLIIFEFIIIGYENIIILFFIPIMILIIYFLFQLLPFFGGADVKALMALSILVPYQPDFFIFPIAESILPYVWVILSNSVLIYLVIPISLLIFNIYKKNLKFPHCLLGYNMELLKAKNSFVWPLETIVKGKRKISYLSMNKKSDDIYKMFEKKNILNIWVTPKIPFMIPLLIGFIISFFIGDILFLVMSYIL